MDRFVQRSGLNKIQAQPAAAPVPSNEPPRKRPRFEEVKDSEDDESEEPAPTSVNRDEDVSAFEDSLAAVATDKQAIEEYEALRASQASQVSQDNADNDAGSPSARMGSRQWVRGKSSIYVDAFNLALDTVLEDEAHLFDRKETRVFEQWRGLSYEAQYL